MMPPPAFRIGQRLLVADLDALFLFFHTDLSCGFIGSVTCYWKLSPDKVISLSYWIDVSVQLPLVCFGAITRLHIITNYAKKCAAQSI